MNIRPFQMTDIDKIDIDEAFKGFLKTYVEKYGETHARIGEKDGKPVFACGITPLWAGVGEVWIRVMDKTQAISIVMAVKELIRFMIANFDFHRIQATVRADDEQTLKFDNHIGLKFDVRIPEYYSDKCDAIILRYKHGS